MGQGGGGGGECRGPDGGRAGTQEHPAVEREHVCSPSFEPAAPERMAYAKVYAEMEFDKPFQIAWIMRYSA